MSLLHKALKAGRKYENAVPTALGGLGLMLKLIPHYVTNREERVPKRPLGPFRTDASVYGTAPVSGLRVTWFGHSSMLVELDGVRVLIDPVWDERASPLTWAGPKRFYAPTVPLAAMPPLDAVLLSHDHYDHLGERTVRGLARLQPSVRWVASKGVGGILQGFGVAARQITELDWTEATEIRSVAGAAGCRITALPARHFSGRSLANRFETLWSSFVLGGWLGGAGRRAGPPRVYYGADSGLWDGFAEIGRHYGPFDLTMLEIGAFNEEWKAIHMGPDGAAEAFRALGGAGLLMPIHWGLFDLALHAWRQPMERMEELAAESMLPLWQPEPGRPTEVSRGQVVRSDWWKQKI
jgi:L-ascorbate metabolism protein UlaG (beta-lactamase superfamily)